MCFGGAAREARRASQQAARDAAALRRQMEADQAAMQQEMERNRAEAGRLAPPPAPYRTRDTANPVAVRRKKASRSPGVGTDSLRIPMNTGGGASGGGVNIG